MTVAVRDGFPFCESCDAPGRTAEITVSCCDPSELPPIKANLCGGCVFDLLAGLRRWVDDLDVERRLAHTSGHAGRGQS